MIDKDFCLSSYIAFRYIWKDGIEFAKGMKHKNFKPYSDDELTQIASPQDIDHSIRSQIDSLYNQYGTIGILLSGGMDSAILASYLRPGSHAYTFTASGTSIFNEDEKRAAYYCQKFGLYHHLVDISFDDYKQYTPIVMKSKCSPVHSIEPQIYKAAMMAETDKVEVMVIGDGADYVFGGMDKLLSKDWKYNDFVRRYISLDPELVLTRPVYVYEPFEKYKIDKDGINYLGFMNDLCTNESYSSYMNAFKSAGMPYCDPYELMVMSEPLDLNRVRNGEPKYLIRELYAVKYPEVPVPDKIPMPRPVDMIFKDWDGPKRPEFRQDIPMDQLTGNQKWQLWCAEQFLNMLDN